MAAAGQAFGLARAAPGIIIGALQSKRSSMLIVPRKAGVCPQPALTTTTKDTIGYYTMFVYLKMYIYTRTMTKLKKTNKKNKVS